MDGKWTFEVGERGKRFGQIADIPDSFVVSDDLETGFGNKIPLWLFGFRYRNPNAPLAYGAGFCYTLLASVKRLSRRFTSGHRPGTGPKPTPDRILV